MGDYRKLRVTAKIKLLTVMVYRITAAWPRHELFGLTAQIRRAMTSVGCNLAEGCGRNRPRELAQYTRMALGSANEVEYCCDLAAELGYLDQNAAHDVRQEIDLVKRMLSRLVARVGNAGN